MARWINPPVLQWENVFGLAFFSKYAYINSGMLSNERRYVILNSVANVLGCVLSPLIGIIRVIVNAIFLAKGNSEGKAWNERARGFLKAQIARGVFEIFGGGPLLFLVDIIISIGRSCAR